MSYLSFTAKVHGDQIIFLYVMNTNSHTSFPVQIGNNCNALSKSYTQCKGPISILMTTLYNLYKHGVFEGLSVFSIEI